MTKPVIIAENHHAYPLQYTLAGFVGIAPEAFSNSFVITKVRDKNNVLNIKELLIGRKIVLIGNTVASLFDISEQDYTKWFDHPSWDEFHGIFSIIPDPISENNKEFYSHPENAEKVKMHLNTLWLFGR